MGFFSDLFGKSQRRDYENADRQMRGEIAAGNAQAVGALDTGFDKAAGYYQPFRDQGLRGYDQYADAIGINGADGYGRAKTAFDADPFAVGEQSAADNALMRMFRGYNAQGMGNSGANRAAVSRAASDRYGQRVTDYRNRLMGLGQQGYDASGALGAMAYNTGAQKAGIHSGQGQQFAQMTGNLANATAQSRTQGVNNLLGGLGMLGGTVINAFAPGPGGASAAGNMYKAWGR